MKKHSLLFALLLCCTVSYALTIPTGTIYYDNAKTKYSSVKFVYGTNSTSYVVSMPNISADTQGWSKATTHALSFSAAIGGIERYFFAETALADGSYKKAISALKDEIAGSRNEKRTATRTDNIPAGQIFVPNNNDQWCQGNWQSLTSPKAQPSGTLPVLYINTKDSKPIESKETYLKAYYWLDNMGIAEYKSIASKDKPDTMQIKGRGNYTWKDFDKKPFRLKLNNKTAVMGLKKSKHFALLAHADDTFGFLKNPSGFWFSEHLQMPWTPKHEAVELVLNGQYWGLYFLTEVIRVDKDRVNIVEQPDNCTNADSITGGWLMEIDNYWEDEPLQVHAQEGNGSQIWATLHTPEETSAGQWEYINNAISSLNQAIYGTDQQFAEKVDIESAVRFYIVQELMGNRESYHGSCYFYKDMGADAKWFWGPVWDFGNSLYNMNKTWIYDEFPYAPQNFAKQMNTHDNFHQTLVKAWQHFLYYDYDNYATYLTDYANHIASAAANDAARWPSYGNTNVPQRCKDVIDLIDNRVKWLKTKWGNAKPDDPPSDLKTMTQGSTSCHRKVWKNNQLLIRVNGHVYTAQGTRVE